MNVKELIEQLKDFPEDMEVTVYADHGQCDIKTDGACKAHIHKNEWKNFIMEGTHPDDVEDPDDYIIVCQIGG